MEWPTSAVSGPEELRGVLSYTLDVCVYIYIYMYIDVFVFAYVIMMCVYVCIRVVHIFMYYF